MTNWIIGFILTVPWVITAFIPNPTDPWRLPKECLFDVFCLGIICFAFFQGIKSLYKNKYIGWFLAWCFFTVVMNLYIPLLRSQNGYWLYNLATFLPTLHLILGSIATLIILSNTTREDFIRIGKGICLSSVIVTLYGILQVIDFNPLGLFVKNYLHPNHFVSCLDNPNVIGNYIAITLPFFLYFKGIRYKLGFVVSVIGVLLAYSHRFPPLGLSTLAGISGVIVYIFLSYRNKRWVVISLLLACLLLLTGLFFMYQNRLGDQFSQRFLCWNFALEQIKHNPLFGQGLGIFKTWDFKTGTTSWTTAHNDTLERICEIGILGVILFYTVIWQSLKRFNYDISNRLGFAYYGSFIAFMVLFNGSFVLETTATATLGLFSFCAISKQ